MAFVVAARHVELDELVAIKILLPHRAANEEVRERFAREARASVKIKSEHVARVTDVGALSDGTPYMVMEYLDGEDLAALLTRRGKIPVAEAVHYTLHVCHALREAHSLGIVHRDVKPANLFLAKSRGRPPSIKVLDFGISKIERNDRRRTETKEVLGSPWYMSPEQLKRANSATPRSDVWSVGVILYELVTGDVPFDGDTMAEVIVKVLHEGPALESVPTELRPIVARCLEKTAESRFASMDDLAAALRELVETAGSGPPPSLDAKISPSASAPPRGSAPPTVPRPSTVPTAPRASAAPLAKPATDEPIATPPPPAAHTPPTKIPSNHPPRSSAVPKEAIPIPTPSPTRKSSGRPIASFLQRSAPEPPRHTPIPENVSLDDVELIDEGTPDEKEEEVAMVQDHELLPSDPPPAVTTPIAPRLLPAQTTPSVPPAFAKSEPPPASAKSAQPKEVPDEPKLESDREADERRRPTTRPPRRKSEPPRVVPPARRPTWIPIAAVAAPVIAFAAMKLAKTHGPPPSTTPAPPVSVAMIEPAPTAAPPIGEPPPVSAASVATSVSSAAPSPAIVAVASTPAPSPPPATAPGSTTSIAPSPAVVPAPPPSPASPVAKREPPKPVDKAAAPKPAADDDDQTVAFQVSRRHFVAVQTACWEGSQKTTATAMVTVATSVEPGGSVTSASATAADPGLARCVEGQVRTWTFPPSSRARSLQIPIRFRR
jgi:serine/threonine protein kinase